MSEENKAHWIDTKYSQWPANEIRTCSACKWSIHKSHLRAKDLEWAYCPNCGAKMEVSK